MSNAKVRARRRRRAQKSADKTVESRVCALLRIEISRAQMMADIRAVAARLHTGDIIETDGAGRWW